jgi:N utilization substance protein A
MNAKELLNALDAFEQEKGISKDIIIEALKEAMVKAYLKMTDPDAKCKVEINPVKGTIEMYEVKDVVEEVTDDLFEIELEDAREIDPNYNIGDEVLTPVDPETLTRLAALQAKQVLTQKIREYEKQTVYDAYIDKKGDIIAGVIERIEPTFILVNIGKTNAIMKANNVLPGEKENFKVGQTVRVYVVDVDKSATGAAVVVSRTDPGFLKRLFESEISEIYDGTVEIKDIAREAGDRAKVSVFSRNKNVDATGSCIGKSGARIQQISNQLLGEKIDVINYYKDPILYIAEALKPANVIGVNVIDAKSAIAIVDDNDFSLAIGKKGINARLAVKLTGTKIDIKSLSVAVEEGIEYTTVEAARANYEYELKQEEVVNTPVVEETTEEVIETTPVIEEVVNTPVVEITPVVEEKVEVKPAVKVVKTEPKKVETTTSKPKKEEKKPFSKPKKEDKDVKRTTINSQELQDIKKQNEQARNYMPVYTDEELESLDDDYEEVDDYYDNVDYDDFDKYYDED